MLVQNLIDSLYRDLIGINASLDSHFKTCDWIHAKDIRIESICHIIQ